MKRIVFGGSILFNLLFLFIAFKNKDYLEERYFPGKPMPATPVRIAMFGNSLTAQGDWNNLLNRTDIKNIGLPGITTYGMLHNIGSVIAVRPKVCFLEGGINDIHAGAPASTIFGNMKKIIDTLIKEKIVPVVQLTFYTSDTAFNKEVDRLNALVKDYALQKGIRTIDMNTYLAEGGIIKPEYTTDGTHLQPQAYDLWSEQVLKALK